MLRSVTTLCLPNTIEPIESGSFETIVEGDPQAAGAMLYYKSYVRSIPWFDRSGKNEHR
jgi:hypothetical protein